jgi:SAM-dependent methyltransferase
MGVTGKLRELQTRRSRDLTRPLGEPFLAPLRGARALELGGPSAPFGSDGVLPAYALCASVDGLQYAEDTVWHGRQAAGRYAPEGRDLGAMHIADAGELAGLPKGAYDVVLHSHVVEHLANPLRALARWREILRPEGHLVMVVPHKDGTFDHRRPVTSLAHLEADLAADTGEDDLTHLEETLLLHDRSRDAEPGDPEAFAAARRDNLRTRLLHHHVFTTPSLLALLDRAGVQIDAVEPRLPHDIYVVGHFPADGGLTHNAAFLGPVADSPFRRDRRA